MREKGSGSGVGVVGFCMGGGLALVLAGQRPDAVKAVVPFYGGIPWDDTAPDYSAIKGGGPPSHIAEKDDWVTPETAAEMAEAISESGNTDVTVHVYDDTDHAFFNDTRPEVYDAEAAALAWQRTVDFLSHLGCAPSGRSGQSWTAGDKIHHVRSHSHHVPPLLPLGSRIERAVPRARHRVCRPT